jgi:hypothetical protein
VLIPELNLTNVPFSITDLFKLFTSILKDLKPGELPVLED